MGVTSAGRAHHTTAEASNPVLGLQAFLQERQQAGQVAGEMAGDEHQG